MTILLLGPQGSGKGTQAKRIAEERGVPHVSTGEMFRALDDATPLGREVNEIMARGDLVPDEITIQMIQNVARLLPDESIPLSYGKWLVPTMKTSIGSEKIVFCREASSALRAAGAAAGSA